MPGKKRIPTIDRLLARIDSSDPDACWIWPGAHVHNGYGYIDGEDDRGVYRPLLVHRVTYRHFVGPIPEGFDLDHLCRVRDCCNYRHVEPVPRVVNARRGLKYRPLACLHGHAYTEENSAFSKKGHLYCRECDRARQRARRLRAAKATGVER